MSGAAPPRDWEATARADLRVPLRSLRTEVRHLERLLGRLQEDAKQAADAPVLRAEAELLKFNLRTVPNGATRVRLALPWDPAAARDVALRPTESPLHAMERRFRRARGMEAGAREIARRVEVATARLATVVSLRTELDGWLATVTASCAAAAEHPVRGAFESLVAALCDRVRALGLRVTDDPIAAPDVQRAARATGGKLPPGVDAFTSPSGRAVLAGRNAAANDRLVATLLRGRDAWFHVKDRPGAHVVLRVDAGAEPAEGDLFACAALAAHLAGVPKGEAVDVAWARGKSVRKAKGAPAGTVYLAAPHTVRVRVDAAVVDAFYQRRASQPV
ncbi:MAG: DUF814 domain-containing protein [Myxococcales bacterium]|nr:DUF814 domain-containing protein [Myxococcales bacterium]